METIKIVFSIVLICNIIFFIIMYMRCKNKKVDEHSEDISDVYLTDEYLDLLRKKNEPI